MNKKQLFLPILFILWIQTYCQVPAIEWSKCLGGTNRESVYSILPTPDGGSLVGGSSMSRDGDITCQHDTLNWWDYWLVKLDSSGNKQWTQCYGGSMTDVCYDIAPTSDGGYILCGYAISNNGDVSGNHGGVADAWVVKINYAGAIEWQKCFGGTALDVARKIIQTSDGGYAFTGRTLSNNGDVSGHHDTTWQDIWVLKMDSIGTFEWSRCIGGTSYEDGYGIVQMDDGTYWVAGECASTDFDGTGNHGYYDYFVARLDSAGNVTYTHSYGGTDQDMGRGIIKTDEGLVLYGLGGSSNGDVVGHINYYDYWILCIDTSGAILWQKVLGGTGNEGAYAGKALADGGFIFSGYSESNNVNVTGNHGGDDAWVVKTDSVGNLSWQMSLGGTQDDIGWAVAPLDNGKIITATMTKSTNGNIIGSHGSDEIWIAELSSVYNNITGSIFYDANTNGVFDAGDKALKNKKITETTTGRIVFSGWDGEYTVPVFSIGSFTIIPDTIPMFLAQPATHAALFFSASGLTDTLNDFAIVPDTVPVADLEMNIYNYSAFRPGFAAFYGIHCRNNGNSPQSGELIIRQDTSLLFDSSSVTPTSVTADSVVIPIDTIQPFAEKFIILQYHVNVVTPIGTALTTTGVLNPLSGDANPADNTSSASVVVRGSYDPNDKSCSRDYILTTEVGDRPGLEFTVRFQNTGNDTAFNILVLDTLSTLLDINTLKITASSHPVTVEYVNDKRLLKFSLSNILLPDSNTNEMMSHGMIAYCIRPYGTLQIGDVIRNSAGIYFDFNAAVMTNTVYIPVIFPTTIQEFEKRETLLLYPNPASEEIRIRLPEKFFAAYVEVFNSMGQRVMKQDVSMKNEIGVQLKGFEKGIYFVKATGEKKSLNASFVVTGK